MTLTDGQDYEARSAFYSVPQSVNSFTTTFTYQDLNQGSADGVAFVLQNSTNGMSALGGVGGSLGYSGIAPSVAIEFNIYTGSSGGVGVALATNGLTLSSTGIPYTSVAPVDLASGHPISATIHYANANLSLVLTDAVEGVSYAASFPVNLPALVGSSNAFVGFTGGSGGAGAVQQISGFSFATAGAPTLTFANSDYNFSVVVSNSFGVVTSTPAALWLDSNGNGIPDWWEMQYFGNLNQTALGDYDGDGVNNLDEYLEGTNPNNAASFDPRLYITQNPGGQVFASPDEPYYTMGQVVTLTAIPDAGQSFLGWSGAATGTKTNVALVMNAHRTVSASFGIPLPVALDNPNLAWTTGGSVPWYGEIQTTEDGTNAAQSGAVNYAQQSWLQAVVSNLTQNCVLSFWWNVSCQSDDNLSFALDGSTLQSIYGTGGGWQQVRANLNAGNHTLLWMFANGSSDVPTGVPVGDCGWVDEVLIGFPPVITNQPASQFAALGATTTLNVGTTGSAPLNYQWYFNGMSLTGQTGTNLVLNNVQPANAGDYFVIISNTFGMCTSTLAEVMVSPSSCAMRPAGIVSWWAGEGSAADIDGTNNGTAQGGVAYTNGMVGQAFYFNGSNAFVSTSQLISNPENFTLGLWFQTATANGGVLLGFGDSQNGAPGNYDRIIYMDNSGALHFGVYSSGTEVISSSSGFNDNTWHYVAATLSATSGACLYVDGVLAASNPAFTSSYAYNGWWRIGEDNLTGWPFGPNSYYFNGNIDEVILCNGVLSAAQVAMIYQAGSDGICDPTLASISVIQTNSTSVVFQLNPQLSTNYTAGGYYIGGGVTNSFGTGGGPEFMGVTGLRPSTTYSFHLWEYDILNNVNSPTIITNVTTLPLSPLVFTAVEPGLTNAIITCTGLVSGGTVGWRIYTNGVLIPSLTSGTGFNTNSDSSAPFRFGIGNGTVPGVSCLMPATTYQVAIAAQYDGVYSSYVTNSVSTFPWIPTVVQIIPGFTNALVTCTGVAPGGTVGWWIYTNGVEIPSLDGGNGVDPKVTNPSVPTTFGIGFGSPPGATSFTPGTLYQVVFKGQDGGYHSAGVTNSFKTLAPSIVAQRLTGGKLFLSYDGILGTNFVLEFSPSLSPADWTPQVTNPANTNGFVFFTNTLSRTTNGFWRIRSTP